MNVLFTTPYIGFPPVGGPELRIANSLKTLARLVELHVFPRCRTSATTRNFLNVTCKGILDDPSYSAAENIGHSADSHNTRRIANRLAPRVVAGFERRRNTYRVTRRHTELILDYVQRHRIRTVWFGYGCISYPLMRSISLIAPKLRIVCDTDSVWSQFICRELDHPISKVRRKFIITQTQKKVGEEKRWVNFCDVTTAVCDADAEYYRSLANDPSKIKIFRNAIDVKAYEAAVPPPPDHRRPNLVMTGSYYSRESPMVRGARWIAREVFPRLMQQIPGLHLYLVGKGSDEFLKDIVSENVTATGKVEATLPYLKHADVALAPLLFEAAGTKFKVLEAAICGVPIVASPVGGEGLPQGYSKHVVTCASADEFVSAIVGIFRNKGVEQGNQLQEFRARVAADFGLEQLARDAAGILRAIGN